MGARYRVKKLLRGIAWFVGLIAWIEFLGAIDNEIERVLSTGYLVFAASIAFQVVATALLAWLIAKKVRIPRAVWICTAIAGILLSIALFGVWIWTMMLYWLAPAGSIRQAAESRALEIGFLEPTSLVLSSLRRVGIFVVCAIVAWYMQRNAVPVAGGDIETPRRLRMRRALVVGLSALAVVMVLGGLWLHAKNVLEFYNYDEAWQDLAPGQTVSLVDDSGELMVLPGWGGHATITRNIPKWTGLSGPDLGWTREAIVINTPAGGLETTHTATLAVYVAKDQKRWQENYDYASKQTSMTALSLPGDVLAGRQRVAYIVTGPSHSANHEPWITKIQVFVSDPQAPVMIWALVYHQTADPPMQAILDHIRMVRLRVPSGIAAK